MKIEITDEQAAVISRACENLARLYMGQMRIVVGEMFPMANPDVRDEIHAAFQRINPESHGITSKFIPERSRIAWDIYQTIRQNLAIRRNGGRRNSAFVAYSDPLKTSSQPLPVIEGHAELVANAEVGR